MLFVWNRQHVKHVGCVNQWFAKQLRKCDVAQRVRRDRHLVAVQIKRAESRAAHVIFHAKFEEPQRRRDFRRHFARKLVCRQLKA